MTFLFFMFYVAINVGMFIFIYSNVKKYKDNQTAYDHIDIISEKSNKEWFYHLISELGVKGYSYQQQGKGYDHYYKHELKMVFFGREFFYTQTIYSLFMIFFNLSFINVFEKEKNPIFNFYMKYHNYYIFIMVISFIGSFLTFTKAMMFSGIIFMVIFLATMIIEFIIWKKVSKQSEELMLKYFPNLTDEQKKAVRSLAKSESFYYFSVFFNKRNKSK